MFLIKLITASRFILLVEDEIISINNYVYLLLTSYFFLFSNSQSVSFLLHKRKVCMCGWLVVTVAVLVEWRFFIEVSGEQCVVISGI